MDEIYIIAYHSLQELLIVIKNNINQNQVAYQMMKSKSLSRTQTKQYKLQDMTNSKYDSNQYHTIETNASSNFGRKRHKSSSMLFRPSKYTRSIKKLQAPSTTEQPLKQLNRKQIISQQSFNKLEEVRKKLFSYPQRKKLRLSQMNNVVSQQLDMHEKKSSRKKNNHRKLQHIMNLSVYYKQGQLADASNTRIVSLAAEISESNSLILNQAINLNRKQHEQQFHINNSHQQIFNKGKNQQQVKFNKIQKKSQIKVQNYKESDVSFILDDNKNQFKNAKQSTRNIETKKQLNMRNNLHEIVDFSQSEPKYEVKIIQPKQRKNEGMITVPQLTKNIKERPQNSKFIEQTTKKSEVKKKKETKQEFFDTIQNDLQEIVLTEQSKAHQKSRNTDLKQSLSSKKAQIAKQSTNNHQQEIKKTEKKTQHQINKFKTQNSEKSADHSKNNEIDKSQKEKNNKEQQKRQLSTYKENLREEIKRLNLKISSLTPVGQTAGTCSKLLKKCELNWYQPAILLYKECYRQFISVEEQFREGNRQGIIADKQLQDFLNQNQIMKLNLEKILRHAKKKEKINQKYFQIAQPENSTVLRKYIYRQVLKFYQNYKNSSQKNNPSLIECTLRMLDSACILIKNDGKKSRNVKNIDQMTPEQMSKILPLLEQIVKDNV